MRAESEGSGLVDYRVARMKPQDEGRLVWVASDGSLGLVKSAGLGGGDNLTYLGGCSLSSAGLVIPSAEQKKTTYADDSQAYYQNKWNYPNWKESFSSNLTF